MSHPVLAAQLYTLRDHTQTAGDFADSMRQVRQMGYTAVQVSGIGPIAPQVVKKIVDDNGLSICITHIGFDRLTKNLTEVIDEHRLWNCRHVAVGSMPGQYRSAGEEGFRQF